MQSHVYAHNWMYTLHICAHECTHIPKSTQMHIVHTYICVHTMVHTYIPIYTNAHYVHIYSCTHKCTHILTYTLTCIHIHEHTHIHTDPCICKRTLIANTMYSCTYPYIYLPMHILFYTSPHMCKVHTNTHIYIHTSTHTYSCTNVPMHTQIYRITKRRNTHPYKMFTAHPSALSLG